MIVQELTRIQREHGYVREDALRALSASTGVPLFRWQEVASFFPHFRMTPPPAVEVHVCQDMSCRLRGACDLINVASTVAEATDAKSSGTVKVHVEGVSCLGRCDRAPAAMVNEQLYAGRTAGEFGQIVEGHAANDPPPPDTDADHPPTAKGATIDIIYNGQPSYMAVQQYVESKPHDPQAVIDALKNAGLLGMGGAGGRAYKKWDDVLQAEGEQKYVVCNADESEPGTFKDRDILLRTPWLILEGMILGGLVVGADRGYVYIRHEYHEQIEAVRAAIDEARRLGACGDSIFGSSHSFHLEVFVSPGGYICGEQTALIEAMEDHRAEPRNRPPQLQTNGLWDKPTLLNNVETFAWVPAIMLGKSGKWFAESGMRGMKGRRYFSISGDVEKPGAYEVPNGLTLGELINDYAGGVRDGREIKAIAASGPSAGFVPRMIPVEDLQPRFVKTLPKGTTHFDLLEWQLDIGMARTMGLMLGAGIVIYNDLADMIDQAWACSRFYRDESCGKCVPCRIGSQKLTEILTRIKDRNFSANELIETRELLDGLGQTMAITSICGLGQVASAPIRSLLQYYIDDVYHYLEAGRETFDFS